MSAPRKRWDEHSSRWQREATKQGLTRSRWDAWFKLSPSARKVADPRRYAQGETVAAQRRQAAEDRVIEVMQDVAPYTNVRTIRLGVQIMTARQLRWTAKAQPYLIRKRAAQPLGIGATRNPWWYR